MIFRYLTLNLLVHILLRAHGADYCTIDYLRWKHFARGNAILDKIRPKVGQRSKTIRERAAAGS
jgi:hypothetical protein